MTFHPGQRVTIRHAANTPFEAGDTGTIHAIRENARELPISVVVDGVQWCEPFAADELIVTADDPVGAWCAGLCEEQG